MFYFCFYTETTKRKSDGDLAAKTTKTKSDGDLAAKTTNLKTIKSDGDLAAIAAAASFPDTGGFCYSRVVRETCMYCSHKLVSTCYYEVLEEEV